MAELLDGAVVGGLNRTTLLWNEQWLTPERCRRYFGYSSRNELFGWVSVQFPDVPQRRSGLKGPLSKFEQICMTLMHLRYPGKVIAVLSDIWDIDRRRAGEHIAQWAPQWEYHSKHYCRLTFSREFLLKCQIEGMVRHYGRPVSHMTDGTVCDTDCPRSSNVQKRALWSNKDHHSGALAIAQAAVTGLILYGTDVFTGGSGEVDLVRIYRDWWDQYPPGFARLVDKGFAWITNIFYKNRSIGVYPAFLTKDSIRRSAAGTAQLRPDQVVDGASQSKD